VASGVRGRIAAITGVLTLAATVYVCLSNFAAHNRGQDLSNNNHL
jgi:hypothetical protein